MKSLAVFCGSSPGRAGGFSDLARDLGVRLAEEGIALVYGGGRVGLMGTVADGCLDAGGTVTGVITHQLMELEVGHTGCTELVLVDSMLERKSVMAERADGFLSLPGGIGTLDEMFEMLTWSQLDLHPEPKPSVILNAAGYYNGLITFLDQVAEEGFVRREHLSMLLVAETIDAALHQLREFQPEELGKWS